jgi:ergothioneine biosynthesis protein EgtB
MAPHGTPAAETLRGRDAVLARYRAVRRLSVELAAPLSPEDQQVQSMPDASPTKWHLAHVTWFFETFVLAPHLAGYEPFHPDYGYLFNSYYEGVGPRHARPRRGLLSRPPLADIHAYRAHVDAAMARFIDRAPEAAWAAAAARVELGLNHEQQHQELLLTDVKHLLSCNPLKPAYREGTGDRPLRASSSSSADRAWHEFAGGVYGIGHDGSTFAFDNEAPRHDVLIGDFRLASHPVTNGEYLDFVVDGGYAAPAHWLSDGWTTVQSEQWTQPLYWICRDGEWLEFTLGGPRPLDLAAPVSHLSYYEADAYSRWAGKRLPSEAEWEVAAASLDRPLGQGANLLAAGRLHPAASAEPGGGRPTQLVGDVWEWTQSPYAAYPGFRPADGAVGEYNGKFMVNQLVLRGGSCLTPPGHIRITYRNFFYPHQRWQMTGTRLAADA